MFAHRTVLLLSILLTFLPGLSSLAQSPAPIHTDHYGDPLPKGARFRLGTVRLRHENVSSLAWLPDGHTLASAGLDSTVRLWQIPGGKQLAQWEQMEPVAFSPDGRTVACGRKKGTIRFIDLATGKERHRFDLPNQIDLAFCAISPDGKLLAAYEWEKGFHLYAVDSGKELRFLEEKVVLPCPPLVFSPDGRALIAMREKGLCRWSLESDVKDNLLLQNEDDPFCFCTAFSPDSKTLAAVLGDGVSSCVTLRSWPEGKELRRLKAEDYALQTLAFSPDGKLLAAGGLHPIRLWDMATGKELRRFEEREKEVINLAFSPDGSLLASAGIDGWITVREVDARRVPRPLTGVGHRLAAVAMTADGRTLLTCSHDGTLTLWDGYDGKRLRTLAQVDPWADNLLLAPDGSRALLLLGSNDKLLRWDVPSGRRLPAFSGFPEGAARTAFSSNGTMLALGSSDGVVHLFGTTKGGEVRQLKAGASAAAVSRLAFTPDGRTLAASYTDGNLILWDLRTGQPGHRISGPRHNDTWKLQFSADGRLFAVVWEYKHLIYLFETASGQEVWRLPIHPFKVGALAFASDNRTLAVGEMDEDGDHISGHAIHLWDIPTGEDLQVLRGHQRDVHTLAFSSDGASLISGSEDRTVLCWDENAVTHRRPTAKQLAAARWTELWTDLADKDAARAQRAIDELIQVHSTALPFLKKTLLPIPPVKMAPITALIADLDHNEFRRRDRASTELAKIGELAASALRQALKEKPSLEMRRRIESLLETIETRPLSPDGLRAIRALHVLETIGTSEAQCILEGLAEGAAEASLTLEAKASLQRLQRRQTRP